MLHYTFLGNGLLRTIISTMLVLQIIFPKQTYSQSYSHTTYYDEEKEKIKAWYQLADTISNILEGEYISYYHSGNIEAKGYYKHNKPSSSWSFFYEKGGLKTSGFYEEGIPKGVWHYYYENGNKRLEGYLFGKQRKGQWRIYYESGNIKEKGEYREGKMHDTWNIYFEDGSLKAYIHYDNGKGKYIGYHHGSKEKFAEGERIGFKNIGHWSYYYKGGVLASEGNYEQGLKEGVWKQYYQSGHLLASNRYEKGVLLGESMHYYENGAIQSEGVYRDGEKEGIWHAYHSDGKMKSKGIYTNGFGEIKQYYPNGKLKSKGHFKNGKKEGKWLYFYEDGQIEGECDYRMDKGLYSGYYSSGVLQMRGIVQDNEKKGSWEMYKKDGTLSGYYKYYSNNEIVAHDEDNISLQQQTVKPSSKPGAKPTVRSSRRIPSQFRIGGYFKPVHGEYKGIVLQSNPLFTLLGFLPLSFEFYIQQRLGYNFVFHIIRNPFYEDHTEVPSDKIYDIGYSIALRQKFYNSFRSAWMWYFAHEIMFASITHSANMVLPIESPPLPNVIVRSNEQKIEYALLLGIRYMKNLKGNSITVDVGAGYGLGYRIYQENTTYGQTFEKLDKSPLAHSPRFSVNIGYAFSVL